jgi:hypothetical protein
MFAIAKEHNTGWRATLDKVVGPAIAPTVWDTVFVTDRVPPAGFLVVEFKDGRQVAGVFARDSIVQTSPEPHGLFLEREWALTEDGVVWFEVPATRGLLIPTLDDVRAVRILGSDETSGSP